MGLKVFKIFKEGLKMSTINEAVKGQDTESRREGAKERAVEKKSGKIRKNTLDPKEYATQQKKSIEWHDKRTKGRYTPGQVSDVNEVAPPGWGHTKAEKEKTKPDKPKSKIGGTAAAFKRALDDGRFKGLPGSKTKKEKTADMFKLMWSMKKKGDKPHYKPGTDKKYKKYQESLSVKDTRKLNKASALSQSDNPKDQDRARARQVEVDYKDLMRQIKAKKKMRSEEATYKQRDKELKKSKKAMDYRHKTIHKGGDDDVNEATTMKDNNLFGNAYAGSYETLKKKIGSKKKHDKPAIKEGISYKDFMRNVYID